MKRFKFSLEAVRVVRRRKECEAMEGYARALQEQARAQNEQKSVERELAFRHLEWREQAVAGCSAGEMVRRHCCCEVLEERRRQLAAAVAAAAADAEGAFDVMLRARQAREAVDKFYESQRVVYDRKLRRDEQKFLDELAGRRPGSAGASKPPFSTRS